MTFAIPRHVVVIAAAALSSVLLVGCGGPSQVGAAAVVGDQSVSLDSVQQEISAVLAKEPQAQSYLEQHKFDQYARQIVANRVQHLLVTAAAQREGLTVDQQQLNQVLDAQGGAETAAKGTIYTPDTYRAHLQDLLLQSALGQKYAGRLSITVDYTTVLDRNSAAQLVNQIAADPGNVQNVMTKGSVRGAAPMTNQVISVAESQQYAGTPLFGAQAGTVVAFPVQQDTSFWAVAYVAKRDVKAAAADPQQKFDSDVTAGLGRQLLGIYAHNLGVTINPRYGVWDPIAVSIAPSKEESAGIQVATANPAG